ncbi:MAG: lipoyl(octanoyl) transferase [Candidatus Korobacteraceae bacterium]
MIFVLNLGQCDHATALRLQETLVELRQQGRVPNVLLFVEHPPVITLGRNASASNIVASRELLASRGVQIHEINRGGDVTFHGPGQLVAYPIFDLRSFTPKLGVIAYVRLLEDVLMRICAHYRIETQRICKLTGVWTLPTPPPRLTQRQLNRDYVPSGDAEEVSGAPFNPSSGLSGAVAPAVFPERKIAAIGVHIARGVTSHGFALNVTTPLDFFQLIVPCGLAKPVTSIEFETGLRPSLDEVMTIASRTFGELFHSQMLWLESIHDLLPENDISQSPAPEPTDTPARAPENERRIAHDDTHLA